MVLVADRGGVRSVAEAALSLGAYVENFLDDCWLEKAGRGSDHDSGLWEAGDLLPMCIYFAHMYANKIFDQEGRKRLVQRKLDRVFGGLVVPELVLQLINGP